MKVCITCGAERAPEEFYRHKAMKDGRLGSCIICVKARVSAHRIANLTRVQAYDRGRGLLAHRKDAVARRRHRYVDTHASAVRNAKQHSPEKYRARNIFHAAVRDGKVIPQPCERCATTDRVQGHHDDYSKPLDVKWLCTKHHGERHRELNAQRRAAA